MDILAIISLLATVGLVIGGIIMGGSPGSFVNLPSILITVGGTLAAIGIATPKRNLIALPEVISRLFRKEKGVDILKLIGTMSAMAKKARAEGLLALEEEVTKLDDGFARKSTQLVIDGTPPELVKSIMDSEIDLTERRFSESRRIFDLLAELAPGFGLLGTLIGLIQMLRNLDTPEALGPGMAVALLTTFYGSFIANALAIPMSKKLDAKSSEMITSMEIVAEGILSIQAGENPRLVEEKLKIFLSPEERLKLVDKSGKSEKTGRRATSQPASDKSF